MAAQNPIIDIKSGPLFPFPFLVLGAGSLLAGIGMFVTYPIISLALVLLGGMILTANGGTQIDPSEHTYREYNSFLFIKRGKARKYEGIERIFINSGKVSQKVYTAHTMNSSTFSRIEYNAYLKFSEGRKIFLVSSKNKMKLFQKLRPAANLLNISVVDNTVSA